MGWVVFAVRPLGTAADIEAETEERGERGKPLISLTQADFNSIKIWTEKTLL